MQVDELARSKAAERLAAATRSREVEVSWPCIVDGCVECRELPARFTSVTPAEPYRVRVSGPQVGANKRDSQDRPVCWVFDGVGERLCHEVTFHGATRLRRSFDDGCPATGAIIWLETYDAVTLHYAANREHVPHVEAFARAPGQEARL